MNELTAATHLTFMSGKTWCARVQEKERPPSVCKREGVPSAPVREREWSAGKKKKAEGELGGKAQRARI